MSPVPNRRSASRRELWALAGLLLFTVGAVAAYWNFALHPDRIPPVPAAMRFFSVSFPLFARLHIAVAALVLAWALTRRLGPRWIPALVVVYTISFAAEHVGTGFGYPFGSYAYSDLLGPKMGGRVPVLIPLSWFLMSVPAWAMARVAHPRSRTARIALAALLLTVWDLALDPAMSFLTSYWSWHTAGRYYGMPWTNLVGWYATGLLIMSALDLMAGRVRAELLDARWAAAYYAVVLLMPAGMVAAAGLWPAVGATAAGVGACIVLTRAIWRSDSSRRETSDGATVAEAW